MCLLSPNRQIIEHFLSIATKKQRKICLSHTGKKCIIQVAMKKHDTGAIILGMHDAIVSLTGLIAGLYFASVETNIIVISCIISSISASLSMGAANYLAVRANGRLGAFSAAFHTFFAYMTTCVLLILPFFVIHDHAAAVCAVFTMAVLIILGFNLHFYRRNHFWRHFGEMLGICTVVSIVAFLIGETASRLFGI